jgi:spore maturation protein CgeB
VNKVKILFFCQNRHSFNQRSEDYFKHALLRMEDVEVRFVHHGGEIRSIMNHMQFYPDFIYIQDLEQFILKCGSITGLNAIKIPIGLMFNDLHRNGQMLKAFVEESKVSLIFAHYRDAFKHFFPEYIQKFRWLPYAVNIKLFKDYKKQKKINFLLMGAKGSAIYPLRHHIYQTMKHQSGFVCHSHPGYKDFTPTQESQLFVGERYAKEINRAKIFFTDHLIYGYPVKKYFEVPACRTLLLASGSQELSDLGFIDGHTFVQISKQNVQEKAAYYLLHKDERKRIAHNGYMMVRERHSTEKRAQQFMEMIRAYLGGG